MSKSKEQQQGRILEYKNFDMKKVKVLEGGVEITHFDNAEIRGEVTKKGTAEPHPDLQKSLNKLQLYMASRLGLLEGWDFSRQELKKNSDALQAAMKGHEQAVKSCKVSGITFKGEGDTFGVVITGSIALPDGGSVGLALPKINFYTGDLGYEEEVQELCEEVKKEVYAYRFLNKQSQQDLFSVEDESNENVGDVEVVEAEVI